MPLTRVAQQAQEADTVRSAPGREGLYAPTVDHVTAHLQRICKILRSPNTTDVYKQRCREDADALLERYLLLASLSWPADEAQAL